MKKLVSLLLLLFVGMQFTLAQSDCTPYVPTAEGTTWEITNYSPKGKETGKILYELIEKEEAGGSLSFTIKATTYDKKGNETYVNSYQAHCVNGLFQFDMAFMIDGESMQAYQSMDVDVDASSFEIPSLDASPGTKLKDGTLNVSVGSGTMPMFQMTVLVTDREILSREDKVTPAGKFDCLVLSQRVSTKMLVKIEGSSKEWYAEGVGMVRSESYNKSGKLAGYSELTALHKK